MKNCELCKVPARVFCDSDQASLCWDCDAKVHTANFLVARHVRQLLCRTCLSPTPWKASGASLSNAASLCHRCAEGQQPEESQADNDEEFDTDDEDSDDVAADKDADNQVVAFSSTPPPPTSSSSSEWSSSFSECENDDDDDVSVSEPETTTKTTTSSLKRQRDEEDAAFDREPQGLESRRRWGVTQNRH